MRFKVGDSAIFAIATCTATQKYVGQMVTIEEVCTRSDAGNLMDYALDITELREFLFLGRRIKAPARLLCMDWQLRKPDDPTFNFEDEETELEEELCEVR